jgi:serine/threonine protein phosphatase PrpC
MIEIGHISHPGNKRTLNEDCYNIDLPNRIAIVVDGMGGADAGDIASAFVREQLYKYILQDNDPISALKNAGQALRIQRPQQGMNPSGASALVLVWNANEFQIAWVGACRAFLFNGQHTQNLSSSSAEPSDPKNASLVLSSNQALGVTATDKLHIHHVSGICHKQQSILLCSDGLLDECKTAYLHELLANKKLSAQEAVEQMLFHALQGSADNNITALLLRFS